MDSLEMIRSLYGYNHWVNQLLFDLVERVPAERTQERFGGSFDTIHGTCAHIIQAEIFYYHRWRGQPLPTTGRPSELKTIAELRARWLEQRPLADRFVQELTPERLAATVRYTGRGGEAHEQPLWQLMLQMVNHGTHHRAELADMLTRVGCVPPPTDYTVYCQEQQAP